MRLHIQGQGSNAMRTPEYLFREIDSKEWLNDHVVKRGFPECLDFNVFTESFSSASTRIDIWMKDSLLHLELQANTWMQLSGTSTY